MIRSAVIIGLLGLFVATGLFVWRDADLIFEISLKSGLGVIAVVVVHCVAMLVNARAWQILVVEGPRPGLMKFFWAVWLRESVNGLLPVARVGGEVVTARLLNTYGMAMPTVVASLAADVTICIASQFAFTVIGICLFIAYYDGASLTTGLLGGAAILLAAAVASYFVQKRGIFRLVRLLVDKMFGERFSQWTQRADDFDASICRVYQHRRAIIACFGWQLLGWLIGAVEIAVALYVVGVKMSWMEPVIIESLVQAASSSAFMVPGALGVQEATFVIVSGWLGIVAELALVLALIRRARDVVLFAPALVFWQIGLGRDLIRAGKREEGT